MRNALSSVPDPLTFTPDPLLLWREAVCDLVVGRRLFEERAAFGFEPRVAAERLAVVSAHAEEDARLDAVEREVAVEHGRALRSEERRVGKESRSRRSP